MNGAATPIISAVFRTPRRESAALAKRSRARSVRGVEPRCETSTCYSEGRELVLPDGARVRVETLKTGDARRVAEVFSGLSEGSRYYRFAGAKPVLPDDELARLAAVDHVDHEAVVAIEPATGRAVAIARFVRDRVNPRLADIAFEVVDRWQSRGLGTRLAQLLACRAREEGVDQLRADVLATNTPSQALIRGLGRPVSTRYEGPTLELVVTVG